MAIVSSPEEVHPSAIVCSSTDAFCSSDSTDSDSIIVDDESFKPRRIGLRTAAIVLGRFRMNWLGARHGEHREDRVLSIDTQATAVGELMSPLTSGGEGTARKIAEYGTKALAESLPELLRTLQAIASVHPFISLAVGAFRVAIELDLKRRENDKKINLLFVEMRDMMTALLRLDEVNDPAHIGPTGKTIQEKLQPVIDQVEADILTCANVCDTYAKQSLVARVFAGPRWDAELQQYIKRFEKRRADMQFTIAVHLGMSIDAANRQLSMLHQKALTYLESCISPEEKELATFIKRKGGRDVILKDDRLLMELAHRRSSSIYQDSGGRWAGRQDSLNIQELRETLLEDPAISITRNSDAFERKFEMQERELLRIQEIVHEENAHVIKSIASGPHDKIHDNDLHNIWREMLDRLNKNEQTFTDCDRPTRISEQDEWTLEYISVTRLQAIIEAFDDDASGFITIAEVNTFTASKPHHWSLLHWMAYWAVGWQMTMTRYVVEIDHLLDKMFAVKSHVLPANRRAVERYLDQVWSPITELTTAFRRAERNDVVEDRFRDYADAEEDRLREGLMGVKYDIDAADTLQLYLFPLLYLLLKRDYEIMRLSRNIIIHKDELWDSSDTLQWVFRAVDDRYTNLENLFKQQNLDPTQQFRVFASELFRYRHDPTPLWSTERLREAHYPELHYNDAEEDQFVDPDQLLNHPIEDSITNPFASPPYLETWHDLHATGALEAILGQWSGFLGNGEIFPSEPMLNLHIHASPSSPHQFIASGEGGATIYTFTLQYSARYWPKTFRGRLSDEGRELSGTWTCSGDSTEGTFLFRRLPPESMRFWPLAIDSHHHQGKARVLWQFVCSAVRGLLRQRIHFLIERQQIRQRFLQVVRASETDRALDKSERQILSRCYRSMTPSEGRHYYMFYESLRRIAPQHFGISCVNCHDDIFGSRIMCLDCGIRTTVDLCGKPSCRDATVGPDRRDDLVSPHLLSHRILKVRRVIHRHREFGKTYRAAQAALIRAEDALADAEEIVIAHSPTGHGRSLSARIRTEALAPYAAHALRPLDECFVCLQCEESKTTFSGEHKRVHGLVRCGLPRDDASKGADIDWSHSRMDVLETKIDAFQQDSAMRFDALHGRLSALEARSSEFEHRLEAMQTASNQRLETLDARLERIEGLLAALSAKL
ncbi:hypothetical protein BN946_scf184803.g3 [Trametes cinnabarina]|uniref:EF-hand domain-containing protein n=1 Tax=Pycnoporus cinnabarinus TaxID=5643 RepID=A0A060S659_PYCCI|nr:hypothetical protein BN946_scf184803.g3 [Trametes cinnabarina]